MTLSEGQAAGPGPAKPGPAAPPGPLRAATATVKEVDSDVTSRGPGGPGARGPAAAPG